MGILDDLSSTFTKGTAVVERNTKVLVLKSKIGEAKVRRNTAYSNLGSNLYEATRFDPALRAGRETLYDAVAACNAEIEDLENQISELECNAAQPFAQQVCPVCNAPVASGSMFCSQCGASVHVQPGSQPYGAPTQEPSQGAAAPTPAPGYATPVSTQPQTTGYVQVNAPQSATSGVSSNADKAPQPAAPQQEYEVE